MLRLISITKSFQQRGIVLDNLDLEVREGDSVAITGPSGSGKTTLLNIIGTLENPDSGEIIFRGSTLRNLTPDDSAFHRNRNLGFVFQDHLLLPHLTVKENIMLPVYATAIAGEVYRKKEEYAEMLMERTGISGLENKYPINISGGEAQRVTLVRALINKPSLLLADEPTGSLDSKNAEMLGSLLIEMNKEYSITLITATHSASLASKMKFHLRLENGKLNQ
jgi:ABC-type lipoprotein export system ATPase subunit